MASWDDQVSVAWNKPWSAMQKWHRYAGLDPHPLLECIADAEKPLMPVGCGDMRQLLAPLSFKSALQTRAQRLASIQVVPLHSNDCCRAELTSKRHITRLAVSSCQDLA